MANDIPVGSMPNGMSIAGHVAANDAERKRRQQQLDQMKNGGLPQSGAWSVGSYGDILPPRGY
jgi:hypothetical protein